jgi:hypothetical protein
MSTRFSVSGGSAYYFINFSGNIDSSDTSGHEAHSRAYVELQRTEDFSQGIFIDRVYMDQSQFTIDGFDRQVSINEGPRLGESVNLSTFGVLPMGNYRYNSYAQAGALANDGPGAASAEAAIRSRFTITPFQNFTGSGSVSFSDASIWSDMRVPGVGETAVIAPTEPTTITFNEDVELTALMVGNEDTLGTPVVAPIGLTVPEGVAVLGLTCLIATPVVILAVERVTSGEAGAEAGMATFETLLVDPGAEVRNDGSIHGTTYYRLPGTPNNQNGDQTILGGTGSYESILDGGNTTGTIDGSGTGAGLFDPVKPVAFRPGSIENPIGTMTVTNTLEASFDTEIEFELAESGHDQIVIGNLGIIDGNIEILTHSGWMPNAGDEFDLLFADELRVSAASLMNPVLPDGLAAGLSLVDLDSGDFAGKQALRLTIQPVLEPLAGDFNRDGTIDAADYVVWRDGLGTTFTQPDYDVWRANFGNTRASGVTSHAAVPEQATMPIALLALAGVAAFRRIDPRKHINRVG